MTVPGGPLFVCVALGSNGGVDALGLMGLSGAGFWVQVWNGTSLGCRTCRTCSLAADSSHTEVSNKVLIIVILNHTNHTIHTIHTILHH